MCLLLKFLDPSLTLVITTAVFYITEPDEGDRTVLSQCFEATVAQPRRNDALFEFILSNSTTALPEVDIMFSTPSPILTVPAGFSGFFNVCAELTILGDDLVEDNEVVIYSVVPLSDSDVVQFPEGADSLILNIIDNDGSYN